MAGMLIQYPQYFTLIVELFQQKQYNK